MKNEYRFFTLKEVAIHNKPDDIFVSVFGRILNLTSLVEKYGEDSDLIKPLLMFAGKDVSHWFDKDTGEFLHYTDLTTATRKPFVPHGLVPHVTPTSHDDFHVQWWKDDALEVGRLTTRLRLVRVINTLTGLSTLLETCCEDTCTRIRQRYLDSGFSDDDYVWLSATTGLQLEMSKTLDENGILDESQRFAEINLPTDRYVPALFLVYQKVFTEAPFSFSDFALNYDPIDQDHQEYF